MKRTLFSVALSLAATLILTAMMLAGLRVHPLADASSLRANSLAHLDTRVVVQSSGRGRPLINLSDGHSLLAEFTGDPEAINTLQSERATGLALAAGDFDEDGVPDLVSAYSAPSGGIITLHRGNADSIDPNSPDAQQRRQQGTFTTAPFLSPALVLASTVVPDFAGTGDLDGDGHLDLILAARGGTAVSVLPGDGGGGFRAAKQIQLPGRITAMVVEDVNRRDGLADLVVCVVSPSGAKLLVFESPEGAINAQPETFALPSEASAIATASFDNNDLVDIVAGGATDLTLVRGRDRRQLAGGREKLSAIPVSESFPFSIKSLAAGSFRGQRTELAVLSDDGTIRVIGTSDGSRGRTGRAPWGTELVASRVSSVSSAGARLTSARVSSLDGDSIVAADPAGKQLRVVTASGASADSGRDAALQVEGEPAAVLPMRLNADALSDLVVLRRSANAPVLVPSSPAMTFTVLNTSPMGAGSLFEAITLANASPGADLIVFALGPGTPTINVGGGGAPPLPFITDAVFIDGTTGGSKSIELNGAALVFAADGLTVQAPNCTIKGLVINRFNQSGISLRAGGNCFVQGNLIGTDSTGAAPLPNNGGVSVTTPFNTIGGTIATARNVISGNQGFGVSIAGPAAAQNKVVGNFIGTNISGSAAVPNLGGGGIVLDNASTNSIGGSVAGSGNLVSGNGAPGVTVTNGAAENLIQGNLIGTSATGNTPIPNAGGVRLAAGANSNSVGGAGAGEGNTIGFNDGPGVAVITGADSLNAILSNSIFSNSGLGIDLGTPGVTPNDPCDVDPGPNNLQNFPVLKTATTNGSAVTIDGTLNSTLATTFRIEFFSNPDCDPSGNGEGRSFIGSAMVTTDAACNVTFSATLPVALPVGTTVTATATDSGDNTSEFSACAIVTGPPCTLTCPPDVIANTGPNSTLCGALVGFPAPQLSGSCFPVSCTPPSGSFFPVGTLTVNCNGGGTVFCAFSVTVIDNAPPKITCPPNVSASTNPGAATATVNYSLPQATDNCSFPSVTCVPPPGGQFALGATTVNCTAKDTSGNSASCAFVVSVVDNQAPIITCPNSFVATPPAGQQCPPLITYPPPSVADNVAGATVSCSPPSGSGFPAGVTTVTCAASDAAGNRSTCSFTVTVTGPPLAKVNVSDGSIPVTFPGTSGRVEPRRKPLKRGNPCALFSVQNAGFSPLVLTLDSVLRTGADVDSGRITNPDDRRLFVVSLASAGTPLDPGSSVTISPCVSQSFCVQFNSLIPALANKTTGLSASDTLPDNVTANIIFRQNGGASIAVPIVARVGTGAVFINANNPKKPAVASLERNGNEFIVTSSVFDSNLDVRSAKYEFLDRQGSVVQEAFDVDLSQAIRELNLVRGQSFTIVQRFSGASSHSEVASVRITVSDSDGSDVVSATLGASAAALQASRSVSRFTIVPPILQFSSERRR